MRHDIAETLKFGRCSFFCNCSLLLKEIIKILILTYFFMTKAMHCKNLVAKIRQMFYSLLHTETCIYTADKSFLAHSL